MGTVGNNDVSQQRKYTECDHKNATDKKKYH